MESGNKRKNEFQQGPKTHNSSFLSIRTHDKKKYRWYFDRSIKLILQFSLDHNHHIFHPPKRKKGVQRNKKKEKNLSPWNRRDHSLSLCYV